MARLTSLLATTPVLAILQLADGRALAQDPGPTDATAAPNAASLSGDIEQLSLEDLLNPTVSTATKSVRTLERTPAIVSVFRREDIDRLGARQLIDLLRHVPGFYEVSGQLERNVAIRGIHGASPYHFVVLLDGLPMNDFLFSSSSPESFSLELADRVEIIRGPGSAIYGANALMGVVNIITAKPGDSSHGHSAVSGGTNRQARGDASFNTSLGGNRGIFGAVSFWRQDGTPFSSSPSTDLLRPSIGANTSDGIETGENLTSPQAGVRSRANGYGPSYNVFLKYQADEGTAVRLLLTRNESILQRTSLQSLYDPQPFTQAPTYQTERTLVDLEKRWGKTSEKGQLTLRPSLLIVSHDMRSQAIAPAFYLDADREQAPVISGWTGRDVRVGPSLEYAVDLPDAWIFHQTNLVAGVQGEYDLAANYSSNNCYVDGKHDFRPSVYNGVGTGAADLYCVQSLFLREGITTSGDNLVKSGSPARFGDGDEVRFGSFFQLTSFLPHDIGLVAGGRVDYNVTYAPQFSPRLALVAPLGQQIYTKAQFASGFVYPAFLYRTANAQSYGIANTRLGYEGNPDIRPQSIRTVEALLGWKSDRMRTELSAYYNDVQNFITYDVSANARTGEYRFSNQGNLKIVGAEATGVLRLLDDRLLFDVQGTIAHPLSGTSPQFLVDGQLGGPTKYPELLGRAMISASPIPRLHLTIDGSFSTRVKETIPAEAQFQDIVATDGKGYSSRPAAQYDTRDIYFNFVGSYSFSQRIRTDFAASNLLNRRGYRPGSVLVPYLNEGRRMTLTLSYSY